MKSEKKSIETVVNVICKSSIVEEIRRKVARDEVEMWAKSHVSFLPPTGPTMKLTELERPAVRVWSPASQYPVSGATGTSSQQLDVSFSTKGTLEIYEVDFRDPSLDLKHKGVLSASSRFHKLISRSFGNGLLESSGVIAGGRDNGMLTLYNVTHTLSSGKEPVIAQKQKHTGLDFNPFQLSEDIRALCWNQKVQHILSFANPSGMVVVWDLRKNKPIIKVSDHYNRVVYKLSTLSSWCFDVQWCPQDPSVFSAASFDGWINLSSVMGWSWEVPHMRQADKVAAPFPRPQVDPQSSLIPLAPVPASLCQGSSMQTAGVNVALGPKADWPLSVGLGLRPGPQDSWEDSPTPRGNFRSKKKTKKKLDEAAQCLEGLYEKLCEGTLSPHAVAGLHGVARCVDAGSSTQGLEVHACGSCSGVSGASSFTPVPKAVLPTAHQLQG